jgi:hypothetical protein
LHLLHLAHRGAFRHNLDLPHISVLQFHLEHNLSFGSLTRFRIRFQPSFHEVHQFQVLYIPVRDNLLPEKRTEPEFDDNLLFIFDKYDFIPHESRKKQNQGQNQRNECTLGEGSLNNGQNEEVEQHKREEETENSEKQLGAIGNCAVFFPHFE